MADKILYRLLLGLLSLGVLVWSGLLVVRPLKQSGQHLIAQVSHSTKGRIATPQAYLRWCARDWGCTGTLLPHLWSRMPTPIQRQGSGMLGLGVLMLLYLALTREVSKTIERRRFEPTHKVR
jgi:hypothetical protein